MAVNKLKEFFKQLKKKMSPKAWAGVIAGTVVLALVLFMVFVLDIGNWQQLDMDKLHNLRQTTMLYDANGDEIAGVHASENRRKVALDAVPRPVQLAFLAAEDARFYSHPGIDLYRIGGALVSNIKSMSKSQGASTITQQLIKLTHLSPEKTLSRKAQEAFMALQLERRASKDEILEMYLNVIYFGNGAYGIEAASQAYFSKGVEELTLAEGALLAAIIKSPSNYAPHIHPDNALRRRNAILEDMAEYEFITEEEARQAASQPIELNMPTDVEQNQGYYVDAALAETEALLNLSSDELLSGGYKIYTAMIPEMQDCAQSLFEQDANFPAAASDGVKPEAAMSAVNTQNGEIHALMGGRSYDVQRGFNRAVDMRRQPGSTIKPISVYLAAVDRFGYLPSGFIDDTQREFADGYSPRNAGGNYHGLVTLRQALSRSMNVATVDLAQKIGMDSVREYVQRTGIELDERDKNLSLALGSMTYGVSPAQLAAAYAPLANGGMSAEPHCVRRVEDASGKVIYEFKNESQRVCSESSAYLITDMLQSTVEQGTATALQQAGCPVAAKTGSVSLEGGGNRDAWVVAYTPDLSVAVWTGFDETDSAHHLANGDNGSNQPAKLAAAFLKQTHQPGKPFQKPEGLVEVLLDQKAMDTLHQPMLAGEYTPKSYLLSELFPADRQPTQVSTAWSIPEAPMALSVQADENGYPVVSFTANQTGMEYRLLRRTAQDSEPVQLTILSSDDGLSLQYTDYTAPEDTTLYYSAIARNAELYREGINLESEESMMAVYDPSPKGFFDWLWDDGPEDEPPPTASPSPSNQPQESLTPAPTVSPTPSARPNPNAETPTPSSKPTLAPLF